MPFVYEHLPDKVARVVLKEPENLILINANRCPHQKHKKCNLEKCCLSCQNESTESCCKFTGNEMPLPLR